MPHIIAIENSESQRRQLSEKLKELEKKKFPLTARHEAQNFGTWNKLFETVLTPGLFAAREVIVIENSETLGEFPETLLKLIEDDKADCILILIFNSDSKILAKHLKAIKNLIEIITPEPEIKPWERPKWLKALAKEQKFKLSDDAAQLLADSIESQEELRSEINKLSLYSEGRDIKDIKLEDVQNLSFDEGGRSLLMFLDGICENNLIQVSRALKYLRTEDSILPALTAITNRLRPALMLSCFNKNFSGEVLKALGTKDYAAKKAQTALKNFGAEKIKIFMAKASRLSFLEKTSFAESWQGFELIIFELMFRV